MARDRRTSTTAAVLLLVLVASGCSDPASDVAEGSPQAVGAAVVEHYDAPLVAVAPLFADDGEDVRRGDLAVDVTFDRESGDNTHVQVVVTDGPPFGEEDAASLCDDGVYRCEERDGATLVLEPGTPEEDPGVVYAWAVRDDVTVWSWAHGPFVDQDEPSEEVRALGEAMVAVVTDPAVGFRTSAAYAEQGEELCDGEHWRRWYGERFGLLRPERSRDVCA